MSNRKDDVNTYKVEALRRFSSIAEGHKKKGDSWWTNRDRAYQLMAMGEVQILEGDSTGTNFETHAEQPLSSPQGQALNERSSTATFHGEIGQPSRSTSLGVLTQGQTSVMPPTGNSGEGETQQPGSSEDTSSDSTPDPSATPVTSEPPPPSVSSSSPPNAAAGSAPKTKPSARAGRSATPAPKP